MLPRSHLCRAAVAVAAGILAGLLPAPSAHASTRTDTVEARILERINQGRAKVGKKAQVMHAGLRAMAQKHSSYQSSTGSLSHVNLESRVKGATPDLYESNGAPDDGFGNYCEDAAYYYPGSASVTDEQVAKKFYDLWYNSAPHRDCMLDNHGFGLNVAGVGVYLDSRGYWWATYAPVRDATPPT